VAEAAPLPVAGAHRDGEAISPGGRPASVAAVVLNWRQPDLALQVCADLLACAHPGLRVFVRDNGSADGSAEALAAGVARLDPGGQRVHLELGADNLGFAGGVNCGIRWAEREGLEHVLLANNDVRVPPEAVTVLSEVLRCDRDVGAVGPTILRPDGKVWAQGGALGVRPNVVRLLDQGRAPAPRTAGPMEVGFVPGAFVLCRTRDLVALGGLEESYFMYWEDVDLGVRLRGAGLRSVWIPWVQVTHDAGGSSGGGRSSMRKFMQAANSVRFLRRHGRARWWLALGLFDAALTPFALLVRPRPAWAKLRGLWFGLCGGQITANHVGAFVRGDSSRQAG